MRRLRRGHQQCLRTYARSIGETAGARRARARPRISQRKAVDMLRLFPTRVYSEAGQTIGTALVIERLVDPQRNDLYYRLEDGRIGRATHGGNGCTIVDPSALPPLRRTL